VVKTLNILTARIHLALDKESEAKEEEDKDAHKRIQTYKETIAVSNRYYDGWCEYYRLYEEM